jgi:IQ calmodulin-binding motif
MQCASIKKKGSQERCTALPLYGHTLCGRHARMATPVLWADVNRSKASSAIILQRHIRGWFVRKRLRLNGPGVLSRKNLANSEDLVTCEESSRQHPFTYFAFEENGKIWWFDFETLFKWAIRSHIPLNPYTKVPLSGETKRRIFKVWAYRSRNKMPIVVGSAVYSERVRERWNMLCMLFSSYGFGDIDPVQFCTFSKSDMYGIFNMIQDDISVAYNRENLYSKRIRASCIRGIQTVNSCASDIYILQSVIKLLYICTIPHDPYIVLFTILSAIYRT